MALNKILVVLAVLAGLACVVLGLGFVKKKQFDAMAASGANFAMPTLTVTSAEARSERWPKSLFAVGTLSPAQGITLSAELSGVVREIAFESGQEVKQGDVLVVFDIEAEEANRKAAAARAQLAKIRLERARELRSKQTVAQSELDSAEAQYLEAAAQVENFDVIIAKKRIVAPFDGRVGIRQVNVGQFVSVGGQLVSLQSLDPIYVDFAMPQQNMSALEVGQKLEIAIDAFPEQIFEGTLTAINAEVDVMTRTVQLRGTLDNKDGKLRSGMFVQTNLILPGDNQVTIIPATSILYAPYGDSIFVINETENGLVANKALVKTGEARGDFVSVITGLEPGQRVVSSGVFKLRNGTPVKIDNKLAPPAKVLPVPEDA